MFKFYSVGNLSTMQPDVEHNRNEKYQFTIFPYFPNANFQQNNHGRADVQKYTNE